MKIKDHKKLIAWWLANELRKRVMAFTGRPPAARDFEFRDQIRGASRSVCRNISEGFYRYKHKEFANFVSIAKGSLGETQDALEDALQSGFVTREEFDEMWQLSKRCMAAVNGLHFYLRTTKEPD
ncbi:MAG TPA: four helix bundle protein [Vicinamibacterales bacterium]|nr:four helix bundle protein [Vicinamibacterales bacterium]